MPGDTRTHVARMAKKQRRKIRKLGDLEAAQRKLWQAITAAEEVLMDEESDSTMVLKATHAISQATSTYARLIEVGEMEARLAELEQALEARKASATTYRSAYA
jgi:hypothetical protein